MKTELELRIELDKEKDQLAMFEKLLKEKPNDKDYPFDILYYTTRIEALKWVLNEINT